MNESFEPARVRPPRWGWAWLDLATLPIALLLLAPLLWRLAAIVADFLGLSSVVR